MGYAYSGCRCEGERRQLRNRAGKRTGDALEKARKEIKKRRKDEWGGSKERRKRAGVKRQIRYINTKRGSKGEQVCE